MHADIFQPLDVKMATVSILLTLTFCICKFCASYECLHYSCCCIFVYLQKKPKSVRKKKVGGKESLVEKGLSAIEKGSLAGKDPEKANYIVELLKQLEVVVTNVLYVLYRKVRFVCFV